MAFNQNIYAKYKVEVAAEIRRGTKTPYDYMQEYKMMIEKEYYEEAKAIMEVLEPMKYYTADTHPHIKRLKDEASKVNK